MSNTTATTRMLLIAGMLGSFWSFSSLGSLTREQAEAELDRQWTALKSAPAPGRQNALKNKAITRDDIKMPYLEKKFGDKPEGERSLWISMHGGGGAPKRVNDQQWQNQIRLYQPKEGFYIAPRAPTDTWNLWHQKHIDPMFDRLIADYVLYRGVDPNKVYLMGYSAGGDGVYQLAPRMADRWAAAAMMSGHPNDAKPDNLRNLGFALYAGGRDAAYNRNKVAAQWKQLLADLREADSDGYRHQVTIYPDLGHWMNGRDREALPWMAGFVRNPWPKKLVWLQHKHSSPRFYWIETPPEEIQPGRKIIAEVKDGSIVVQVEGEGRVALRLRDDLVDLDGEVRVEVNGKDVFKGAVPRNAQAITRSLRQRPDPASAAFARLVVRF